jgi:hypothetical protein
MPKINTVYSNLDKPEKNIFIYLLSDPDTNQPKYIGMTTTGFLRIYHHYIHCDKPNKRTGMLSASKLWIKNLKKNNKIFKIDYLEYFENDSNKVDESEEFWISYFKFLGFKLLNHETGGRRLNKSSLEIRALISKKTKEAMNNPLVKEKIKNRPYQSNFKNKQHKESSKKLLSDAMESKVYYIEDEFGNKYRGLRLAAKELGCSYKSLCHYAQGTSKSANGKKYKIYKNNILIKDK